MSEREELARAQAALVAALLGAGPLPEGFDPRRAEATARVLADKRARHAPAGEIAHERQTARSGRGRRG